MCKNGSADWKLIGDCLYVGLDFTLHFGAWCNYLVFLVLYFDSTFFIIILLITEQGLVINDF